MAYWTIQDKMVLDIALNENGYLPDFDLSSYLRLQPDLRPLYEMILECYNNVNQSYLYGLVFAFLKSDGEHITSFQDASDFLFYMEEKKDVVGALLRQLMRNLREPVLLELEYSKRFNPLPIDFNDFQFLMPPLTYVPPYTEDSVRRILGDLQNGEITRSEFPSGLIQVHLPYITRKTLRSCTPLNEFRDIWIRE